MTPNHKILCMLTSRFNFTCRRRAFIVAHVFGDPLSRYTCRSRFPQNPGIFQVWQQYRATPPVKGPIAPVALELPRVSHVKLPLNRCRATGGCSSYTCGCRADSQAGQEVPALENHDLSCFGRRGPNLAQEQKRPLGVGSSTRNDFGGLPL